MVWIKHSSSSSSSVITTYSILVSLSLHFLTTFSSSSSDEGSVFVSQYSTETGIGRNLLQAKIPCKKNFKSENYTILTSQCKAPYQPLQPCCDAFTQFACPFAEFLNDSSTNCSDAMFTYIDNKGFPKGLFSNCKGDQNGLTCPTPPPDLTAGVTVGLGAPPPIIQFLFYTTTLAVTSLFLIS